MIDHSLINLPKKEETAARLIFKYILQYLLERKTKFSLFVQINKLLKILYSKSLDLIDEASLQIVKQLINPPSQKQIKIILNLLAIIGSFICLTPRLFFYIMNFLNVKIKEYKENGFEETLQVMAKYCFFRLKFMFESGASRKELPLENEILMIENMKKISIPIYYFNGECYMLHIESYNSVNEVKKILFEKLAIEQDTSSFGLFETRFEKNKIFETLLDEDRKIMDVISFWENKRRKGDLIEARICLKIKFFYPFPSSELHSFELLYRHSLNEILMGKIPINENLALKLAALALAVDYGDFSKEKTRFLKLDMERLIPKNMISLYPPQTWIDKILINYFKIKSFDMLYAKFAYLEFLKKNDFFCSEMFCVMHAMKKKSEAQFSNEKMIHVAVKVSEIIFFEKEKYRILQR